PSRRLSCARAASFISASMRSVSISRLLCKKPGVEIGVGKTRRSLCNPPDSLDLGLQGKMDSVCGKGLHHALARLLQGALLGRQRLLLAFDRRLLVVLAL